MSKKWIIFICCVLAAAFLLGSTGAIDLSRDQEMKPEDRLIGMIVTTSPVWGQFTFSSGKAEIVPPKGVPVEKKENTSSSRSIPEEYDYVFPGVEGVRLFNVDMTTEYGKQVDTRVADEEFSRIGVEFSHKDNTENGQKITERINGINGRLYYVLQDEEVTFFSASIYQKADGGIYLGDSGGGMLFSKDQMEYSRSATLSDSASYSHTENGEKIVEGRTIKATVQLVYEPVKITLCQYNVARELIQADEYLPGEMPRDITPLRDTVLIVVDTENKTDEEDAKHTYQAISRADTSFYTLQYKGNGYCIEHYHTLKWPDPYLAEDLSWKIEDLTLTVSGHGRMDDYSYINNAPWKKLTYTRLVVEEGITYLGNHSFSDKPDLKEIILPESLTEIGSNAFQNCDGLIEITLPGNVKDIGTYAFADCSRLKKVNLPDTVKMVNTCAFDNCVSLEYINLPASVRNLGMKVFRNCGSLKSITVAENSRAKWHCIEYNLPYDFGDGTPIHLPEGNTSITWKVENDTLFISGTGDMDDYRERYTEGDAENPDGRYSVNTPWDEETFSRVEIGNGITSIGEYAFYNRASLVSVKLPKSVKTIRDNAFRWCGDLEEINLESVTTFKGNAISGCHSLKSVILSPELEQIEPLLLEGCSSLTEIIIPDSVTTIGARAFEACYSLEKIYLPTSVKKISNYVFERCNNLKTIIVEKGSYAEQFCIENELPWSYPES